ncbi:MAG: hypothetical protein ACYTF5_08400, partial [Planctomycetota bacterium]
MKLSNYLVAGAVLVLGSLAFAQGTYTTFGQGCPGSGGGNVCASANPNTTAHRKLSQNSNIFALGVPATTQLRVVMGFELFTQTNNRTTPLTIKTEIYYADATGKPAGSPKATGTMTIGATAGWYRTTFTRPLLVPANQKFFLSYISVSNQMWFPIAASGTKVSHFFHSPTSTAWSGTAPNGFITQFWAWKVICAGSNIPTLSNTGVPSLGTKFSVDLANGRANAPAIFIVGLSKTVWGTTRLPWDLASLGAGGCKLYVSLDVELKVTTDGSGKFVQQLTVPNDPALRGVKFYNQYAVGDVGANAWG